MFAQKFNAKAIQNAWQKLYIIFFCSSLLGTSTQPSFSSVSPTSNRTKTNDTPTPTESFASSMTSGTGTLRQYPCSNNFLNGQMSSMSSNLTTETTPTSFSAEHDENNTRFVY